jgi:hypothetical protein
VTRYCNECGHRLTAVEAARADKYEKTILRRVAALAVVSVGLGMTLASLIILVAVAWSR